MLTCHALRRNLHLAVLFNGLDSTGIYQQMGHTYKPQPRRTAAGLALWKKCAVCACASMSSTLCHPANPLRYPVKAAFGKQDSGLFG